MPIRQTAKKYDFEYASPDGDTLSITYVKNEDREYVEIKRLSDDGSIDDKHIWDLEVFFDITDELRKVTRQTQATPAAPSIPAPQVTDHRADVIDKQVQESMKNQDGNVPPIQSFSPPGSDEYQEVRTGVNPYGLDSVDETPDDMKTGSWQEDVAARKTGVKKDAAKSIKKASDGVGADQLI